MFAYREKAGWSDCKLYLAHDGVSLHAFNIFSFCFRFQYERTAVLSIQGKSSYSLVNS